MNFHMLLTLKKYSMGVKIHILNTASVIHTILIFVITSYQADQVNLYHTDIPYASLLIRSVIPRFLLLLLINYIIRIIISYYYVVVYYIAFYLFAQVIQIKKGNPICK